MENLRNLVNEIAYTKQQNISNLSSLQRSLIPLLSFASSLYKLALFARYRLYHLGFFRRHRLPVPVISVGNLTWGGNGKTPMVEFLALWFAEARISPLILTRGYAGGDEAKMLQRHHDGTLVKIGVGADRAATAACFFQRHGYLDICNTCFEGLFPERKLNMSSNVDKIGVVILDDGMQHWSLSRDLEIVMINGVMLCGNNQLIPLGPLREPLAALERADVAVIHHADLVSDKQLKLTESMMKEVKESLPMFYSRLVPSYFFEVKSCCSKLPLSMIHNLVVLCVSAIGSAIPFVKVVEKLGPLHVDRLVFSDHHFFHKKDIGMVEERLRKLQNEFSSKPVVVVTEKDYDRDPTVLEELDPFEVLVLCTRFQIMPSAQCTEESLKKLLKQLLVIKFSQRVIKLEDKTIIYWACPKEIS